jgi:hypothetical protein
MAERGHRFVIRRNGSLSSEQRAHPAYALDDLVFGIMCKTEPQEIR